MCILIIGGISNSLINFRGPLIRAMLDNGHEVVACAGEPLAEVADALKGWGVRFIPVPLARAGMNPLADLRTLRALRGIMRDQRPDLVLAYTIKPVIWGGLAARSCGIQNIYSLITGLGYAFMLPQTADCRPQTTDILDDNTHETRNKEQRTKNQDLKQRMAGWVAKRLYKTSLKHSRKVFFQNPDDRDAFVKLGLVHGEQTAVVNGSGVDVGYFKQTEGRRQKTEDFLNDIEHLYSTPNIQRPTPNAQQIEINQERGTKNKERKTSFLLIARLLRDKGICEYAEAAAMIKRDFPASEFHLVGDYDSNPSGLKSSDVEAWTKAGAIIYHGRQSDVRPFLRDCDVYVLPSYREGTPRTVLEAMATGRAIITTDAPGCRETVRRGGIGQTEDGRRKTEDKERETADCRLQAADLLRNQEQGTKNQKPSLPPEYPNTHTLSIGANGILIPPRNARALAEAMRFFIETQGQIVIMGRESRRYAEDRYDVRKVNAVMLREMGLLGNAEMLKCLGCSVVGLTDGVCNHAVVATRG